MVISPFEGPSPKEHRRCTLEEHVDWWPSPRCRDPREQGHETEAGKRRLRICQGLHWSCSYWRWAHEDDGDEYHVAASLSTHAQPLIPFASMTSKAADTDFRKKWDKEEYAEKAKKKDQEERERMQENEERMKQGMLYVLPPRQLIHTFCRKTASERRSKGQSTQAK